MRWDLLFLAFRGLMGVGLFGLALKLGLAATRDGVSPVAGAVAGLAGLGLVVMAILCLAPELILLGSAPARKFFDDLFYPRTEIEGEAPNYTLARYYRKQRRYTDAIYWYRRLLELHPQELNAYVEGVATAMEAKVPREARSFYQLGLRKLKSEDAKRELQQGYELLCSKRRGRSGSDG